MTNHQNVYEDLYSDLMKNFTVDCGGKDGTLGEYMMNKTTALKTSAPVAVSLYRPAAFPVVAVSQIAHFLEDKLTVKVPPVKDKTIRRFPLRTSLSSALSAVAFCGFLLCFTVFGAKAFSGAVTNEPVSYQNEEIDENTEAEKTVSESL